MSNALPILSEIARSVLAFLASSAKSERVFSKGGNIVTVKRTRLNPKKVEKIVIIQENKKRVKEFMKKTTMRSSQTKGNASRKSTSKSLSGCTRRSRRRRKTVMTEQMHLTTVRLRKGTVRSMTPMTSPRSSLMKRMIEECILKLNNTNKVSKKLWVFQHLA